MLMTNFEELLIQFAESVISHKAEKDFEITIRTKALRDCNGNLSTPILQFIVIYDENNSLITEEWDISANTAMISSAHEFINSLPGTDLKDLADMIVEDPQKFFNELIVFLVHAA